MQLADLQAALPIGVLLAMLLGPVFFVLLETAAIKGFRAALAFDLGVIIADALFITIAYFSTCLLYTSPSPRDKRQSRMPSSA